MKDESLGRVLGLTQAGKVGWAISGMKQAGRVGGASMSIRSEALDGT